MSGIVAIIPARMAAARLPGKPLLPLLGVPMLQRVFERVVRCPQLREVIVATPDEAILEFCLGRGIPTRRTGEHPSGTDRVAELAEQVKADLFVNVQGDQPLFDPGQLTALLAVFERQPRAEVGTVVAPLASDQGSSPDTVKVAVASDRRALYFSRSEIPSGSTHVAATRWQHIGLYGYTPRALCLFRRHGESPLERAERLEQLRFLEIGLSIHVGVTDVITRSVDTLDDARAVERRLAEDALTSASQRRIS